MILDEIDYRNTGEGVAEVVLNRPDTLNAMKERLLKLQTTIQILRDDNGQDLLRSYPLPWSLNDQHRGGFRDRCLGHA